MELTEYNDTINAFPADRADQPLSVAILPRQPRSGRAIPNEGNTERQVISIAASSGWRSQRWCKDKSTELHILLPATHCRIRGIDALCLA